MAAPAPVAIRPQEGPQEEFLSSTADIVIFGGSARGGKTFGLTLEPLRWITNPDFRAVIFRRSRVEVLQPDGLYQTAAKIYRPLGGHWLGQALTWRFPSGAEIRYSHLRDEDLTEWQGAYVPLICFDELTHFSEDLFFFLLSRNGGTCGIKPYIRATCNPDPFSWVKGFLAPWIDPLHPNPAASGEVRYFIRDGGLITWVEEGTEDAKSMTFIRSSVYDNKILLQANPSTIPNLKALPAAQRAIYLDGSWEAAADGDLFKRSFFPILASLPTKPTTDGFGNLRKEPLKLKKLRYWDLASTEPGKGKDPDYTAGVLLGKTDANEFYVLDVKRLRGSPQQVEALILATAAADGKEVQICMEEEGGSSGKIVTQYYTRVLAGYQFKAIRSQTNKAARAAPVSSYAEQTGIPILRGAWNNDFLNELAAFPTQGVHDDQVDSLSGAFAELAQKGSISFS